MGGGELKAALILFWIVLISDPPVLEKKTCITPVVFSSEAPTLYIVVISFNPFISIFLVTKLWEKV